MDVPVVEVDTAAQLVNTVPAAASSGSVAVAYIDMVPPAGSDGAVIRHWVAPAGSVIVKPGVMVPVVE